MAYSAEELFFELEKDLSPYLCVTGDGMLKRFITARAELPPDVSLETYRATCLIESFYKKFKDWQDADADAKALKVYLQDNAFCEAYKGPEFTSGYDEELWGTFKDEVHRFFCSQPDGNSCVDFTTDTTSLMVGPGSNIGARGYDYYTKLYDSPLSMTHDGLYTLYRSYRSVVYGSADPAESLRHDRYGETIVPGERLSFVLKRKDISRTIGTQPTLNMFFQKMFGDQIESRLISRFEIDLKDQPDYNRSLAILGSKLLGFDTTDLESASNGISTTLCKLILDKQTLGWLTLCRCSRTLLPDGTNVDLHIFSAMGNGFTFPLQTALFACMVAAAYRLRGIPLKARPTFDLREQGELGIHAPTFAVFGDDIVTRREATSDVHSLLRMAGFRVNSSKTFTEGPFRESCGFDYWKGQAVRGVYVKSLRTKQSRCVAFNRLLLWSVRSGIPLTSTLSHLRKSLRGAPLVPLHESDDAGLKVPLSTLTAVAGRDGLQLYRNSTGAIGYAYWSNQTAKLRVIVDALGENQGASGLETPKGHKHRMYNPDGLYDAMLSGTLRAGVITLRSPQGTDPSYRLTRRCTPNWDRPLNQEAVLNGWRYLQYNLDLRHANDVKRSLAGEDVTFVMRQDEEVRVVVLPYEFGSEFVEALTAARATPWWLTPSELSSIVATADVIF